MIECMATHIIWTQTFIALIAPLYYTVNKHASTSSKIVYLFLGAYLVSASTYFMGKLLKRVSRIIRFTMVFQKRERETKTKEKENRIKIECTLATRFSLMCLCLLLALEYLITPASSLLLLLLLLLFLFFMHIAVSRKCIFRFDPVFSSFQSSQRRRIDSIVLLASTDEKRTTKSPEYGKLMWRRM